MEVKLIFFSNNQKVPTYATDLSAGVDLIASIENDIILKSGEYLCIPSGIGIELPKDLEAQVRPRSGMALKFGVTVLNSPGTIDADYGGEIGVILINHSKKDFTITPGMKIAQLIVAPYLKANFIVANQLSETVRGSGGFGSTGL